MTIDQHPLTFLTRRAVEAFVSKAFRYDPRRAVYVYKLPQDITDYEMRQLVDEASRA